VSADRFTYRIDELPRLQPARGFHWSLEAKYRKVWHALVRCAVGNERPEKPLEHALITLVRHSRLEPDPDNMWASWKPVVDGLVRARVLVDDSPANAALHSRWERTPGKGFIVVSVYGPDAFDLPVADPTPAQVIE